MHDKQVNINITEKSPNMLHKMLSYFTTILIVYHGNNSLENMLTDNLYNTRKKASCLLLYEQSDDNTMHQYVFVFCKYSVKNTYFKLLLTVYDTVHLMYWMSRCCWF